MCDRDLRYLVCYLTVVAGIVLIVGYGSGVWCPTAIGYVEYIKQVKNAYNEYNCTMIFHEYECVGGNNRMRYSKDEDNYRIEDREFNKLFTQKEEFVKDNPEYNKTTVDKLCLGSNKPEGGRRLLTLKEQKKALNKDIRNNTDKYVIKIIDGNISNEEFTSFQNIMQEQNPNLRRKNVNVVDSDKDNNIEAKQTWAEYLKEKLFCQKKDQNNRPKPQI